MKINSFLIVKKQFKTNISSTFFQLRPDHVELFVLLDCRPIPFVLLGFRFDSTFNTDLRELIQHRIEL